MDASKINGLEQYSSRKFSAGTEGRKLRRRIEASKKDESFGRKWKPQRRINALEEDKAKVVHRQEFAKISSRRIEIDAIYFIAIINFINNAKKKG